MDVSGIRAIVTGGASGLGRCFALEIARGGGQVATLDLNADGVVETARLAQGLPGRVHAVTANVADEADVARGFAEAADAMGGLDVLINNAGIFRDGLLVKQDPETGAVRTMSLSQWNAVIHVDLTGPFLCTREFAAHCVRTGTKPAVIVNISSIARHGNPGQTNYSAAKAGLVADTKLWAVELAKYGIRTGAIAPGFVDTPILQGMRPDALDKMMRGVPLGRPASPEEIWKAVRFVIDCDYFTGRCIDVDGGLTL
jgi:3-oxoacyl-[acyl-carrier protein] reductase